MMGEPTCVTKSLGIQALLWMAEGVPREKSMDRWKNRHSRLLLGLPTLEEYRQLHLAQDSPGVWPAVPGVETKIPPDRRVDGVAEATFGSLAAPRRGRAQALRAQEDEFRNFRRSLLYVGGRHATRWYEVAGTDETQTWLYVLLRYRNGVGPQRFRDFVRHDLVADLHDCALLTELRTQLFMPWSRALWNSPHVDHDNPPDQRFHASMILGFADEEQRAEFLAGPVPEVLAAGLTAHVSAVHAYEAVAHRYTAAPSG